MVMLAAVPVLAVSVLPEPGTLTDSCVVLARLQPRGLLMQLISHDAPRPSRGLLRLCSSSICMSMLMRRKKRTGQARASPELHRRAQEWKIEVIKSPTNDPEEKRSRAEDSKRGGNGPLRHERRTERHSFI
ncbi:hypothetical protein KOW79_005781 [Hemibagrus wyckioides]|uniref:Secreted protein n=1 Tax=Hemibagrus wyckioides TaxID=337641 RepID=A0A9D3P049_9TELE|nr:hypothetical protein KOW79_005781 [Hemibagrus wyckioides]